MASVRQVHNVVDSACERIAAAVERNYSPPKDIAGMRIQAIENAKVLWPMLHPHAAKTTPDFRLIAFGKDQDFRAEIVYPHSTVTGAHVIFIRGPTDDSVAQAVDGLLEITMDALDRQYTEHVVQDPAHRLVKACRPFARGAGWYVESTK